MVFSKFNKILVFLLLLTSFISLSYAEFPLFEFNENSYEPGEVIVSGQASSGVEVNLYVNDNFVGKTSVLANSKTIQLNDSIKNEIIPIGASLIFRNNNPAKVYKINISSTTFKTLNYAQSLTFSSYVEGDVLYRDEEEGISKTITIADELTNFSFSGIHNYLVDGENSLRFVIAYPLNTKADVKEFEYTVTYDKYPNDITLTNFTNITKYREMKIEGVVSDSNSPLYYLLNIEGDITNTGVLKSIPLNGNSFNFTIPLLREGENTLRLITTNPTNSNIFNGETKVKIISDTIPPSIEFVNTLRRFTNEARLELNISTDAVLLNYTFNEKNFSEEVENENIKISLNLKDGQNDLTLIAVDLAGNIYKEAHQIELDRTNPDIRKPLKDNLHPEELFFGSKTAHFFFQKIDGRTNKPNIEMTIFSFPENTDDRDGNRVSCEMYKTFFYRNLGQLDNDRVDGPELNMNESQLSLLSLISKKTTLTSDSEGNFDAIITLQERSFDRSDYNDAQNPKTPPKVEGVDSKNTICIIMADKYGNVNVYDEVVTLDAGNTMWRAGEITTIPNTMYAAEIEQTGDVRSGNGNVEFGVIARFQYIGPGKVTRFSGLGVAMDTKGSVDSKYGSIDTTRFNWMLDKDTGDLIVYFPVKVKKLNLKPLEYPDKLDFAFQINRLNYVLDDNTIPIDEANPIYFQTSMNIERPLDHSKWLTPATIESIQGFLNTTITYTETAVEYLGYASIGGVLACTGAKFWQAYEYTQLASITDPVEREKEKEKIDRRLYLICDRVASSASPYLCDGQNTDEFNSKNFIDPNKKNAEPTEFMRDGKIIGTIKAQARESCQYNSTHKGYYVTGEGKEFSEETSYNTARKVTSDIYYPKECYPVDEKTGMVNIGKMNGNMCYNPKAPDFDDTRCNFFDTGIFGDDGGSGVAGVDPSTSIISSIRCGAITDTYSHAKNLLKIQQSIYQCLEQAKIGTVKGSYCERLLGQAVCDIATNVILPEFQQNVNPRTGASQEQVERNPFSSFLGQMKANEKAFDSRYKGSLFDKAGLGTDQIINKACLAAITGDWTILTENILGAIDQNEVEPVFGPPFAESRMQGYNPLTGDLSIRYLFTYGVLSGGQRIDTKVEFICDESQPNSEYCPTGRTEASIVPGNKIRPMTLYVSKGGSKQDSIVVTDTGARFWYNVIKFTHTYQVKGETKIDVREFPIIHKQETLIAQCNFGTGVMGDGIPEGFTCDSLFEKDALISVFEIDDKTKLLPSKQKTYFEGNGIFSNLIYSVKNVDTFDQDISLAYMAVCNEGTDSQYYINEIGDTTPSKSLKETTISGTPVYDGRITERLFSNLPSIGESSNSEVVYQAKPNANIQWQIKAITTNSEIKGTYDIKEIRYFNGTSPLLTNKANTFESEEEILVNSLAFKDEVIKINFNSRPENVKFYLVDPKNPSTQILFNEFSSNELKTGTCNLYMRVLPTSQANELTKENFKTYSSIVDENIVVDDKLKTNGKIFQTTFNLGKLSENSEDEGTTYFDLTEPYNNQNICINKNTQEIEIPIKYIIQNTRNKNKELVVDYRVTSTSFGTLKSNTQNGKAKVLGINDETIAFPLSNSLKDSLDNIIDDNLKDKTWAHFFGIKPTQEFILSYNLKDGDKQIEKGEVKFTINLRDECPKIQNDLTSPSVGAS